MAIIWIFNGKACNYDKHCVAYCIYQHTFCFFSAWCDRPLKKQKKNCQQCANTEIKTAVRVSNRKYESMQNQSTAVFPSRSTIGKIETIPQIGMTLKMFAPNAILNQQY